MKLVEYRETLTKPLRQATLCLLVKDDEVLLAMKKSRAEQLDTCDPTRIRTGVTRLKTSRPRPLDDGAEN